MCQKAICVGGQDKRLRESHMLTELLHLDAGVGVQGVIFTPADDRVVSEYIATCGLTCVNMCLSRHLHNTIVTNFDSLKNVSIMLYIYKLSNFWPDRSSNPGPTSQP